MHDLRTEEGTLTFDENEIIERPPQWFLKNLWMDSGSRRDKTPKWEPPKVERTHPLYGPVSRALPGHYTRIHGLGDGSRITPSDGSPLIVRVVQSLADGPKQDTTRWLRDVVRGNIPWNDYPFWYGEQRISGDKAVCRFCLTPAFSWGARVRHKWDGLKPEYAREMPCTKRLQLAYRKCLAAKRCVICKTVTQRHMWGVPLCGVPCMRTFMFTSATWDDGPIQVALGLTREQRNAMAKEGSILV